MYADYSKILPIKSIFLLALYAKISSARANKVPCIVSLKQSLVSYSYLVLTERSLMFPAETAMTRRARIANFMIICDIGL